MTDALIGKQLGDYQIRGLLGRGGMARVYAGYDSHLDRLAAVKVIANDYAPEDRAEFFERFQREARAIARLNHPNIVGVYQFGQYEDQYYMAMVFIEGRDLRQVLRDYREHARIMPFSDVLNVARGIGSALDYAHARGVIHRDVKPSNIMIARDKRAVLTDFGLALSSSDSTLGETFGSAHYIAPEQAISSANATAQSDLYSLGICVYEMLTGRVPFDDPSAMTVALKHLQETPTPPSQLNADISPAVEHVLLRSLEKEPTRRYASGIEFARALKAAYENQQLPDTLAFQVVNPGVVASASAVSPSAPVSSGVAASPSPSLPSIGEAGLAAQTSTFDANLTSWDDAPASPSPIVRSRRPGRLALLIGLAALVAIVAMVAIASGVLNPRAAVTAATALTGTALRVSTSDTTLPVIGVFSTTSATIDPTVTHATTTVSTALATATPTDQPTALATIAATLTVPPNLTVSSSNLPSTAIITTTAVPPSVVPTAVGSNGSGQLSAQLVYDNNQLDLINIGTVVISSDILNKLTFTEVGTGRSLDATTWTQYLPTGSLPTGSCIQVFRAQYASLPPLAGCTRPLVYRRPSDPHLFWTSDLPFTTPDVPPTAFTVLFSGKTAAICPLKDGTCKFTLSIGS